jgi:hypothetical protein
MMTMSSAMLPILPLPPVSAAAAAALRRAAIICAVLAAAALAAGCSALRLGYSQAPTAAYWWLDRYADFDADQAPRVRERIGDWLRWHRATQLPDYAALLARAGREVTADATAAQLCGWIDTVALRIDAAVDEALPALAATAVTLTPVQIDHIERRFSRNDETFREQQLDGSTEAIAARRLDKAIDRAETLYGRLDAAQREQLMRNVAASPFDAGLALAVRRQRQREIVALLRRVHASRLGVEQTRAEAAALAGRLRRQSDNEAWRAHQQRLQAFNCGAGAQLHNLTTAAQRKVAAGKLAGWERDLRVLAADAGT